jgi:hypothetical protein
MRGLATLGIRPETIAAAKRSLGVMLTNHYPADPAS